MSLVELVKIENIVATTALKQWFDLSAVVKAFPEVNYRPKRFPGLVFKLKRQRTTTLIFGTGKLVCIGARKEEDAHIAVDNLRQKLEKNNVIYLENKS